MQNDFEIVLSERDQETLIKDGLFDENLSPSSDSNQDTSPTLQKKAMSDPLRIATVDNFQGEEAKLVIISLVRSNEKKIRVLKTTNRINVPLSRAQHSMYLIGSAASIMELADKLAIQ